MQYFGAESMASSNIDEHFRAIWRRALNEPSLETLTPHLIQSWATARGLRVASVEEREVGIFGATKSIVLTAGNFRACFPKISTSGDPAWELRRQVADKNPGLWEKMEWFSPLWVPMGESRRLLQETENCSRERAIELFNYHTSTIYTVPFQAVCIAQIMPRAHSLREFCPIAREAFLAFYSGYRASSISALIPAIEGGLTRITSSVGTNLPIPAKIDRATDRAIQCAASLHFERMWVPQEYLNKEYLFGQDERVFAFEMYRRWLQRSFFRNTGEYDGVTWLNRHLFAHGTASSWQQSANFGRLIVALATLGVIESWHDAVTQRFFVFSRDERGK